MDHLDVGAWVSERLRFEPVDASKAHDLWLVHSDDDVFPWYDGEKPTQDRIAQSAEAMGEGWRSHGLHKWMVYDRSSRDLIGRGGLSRTPVDDDWGQLYRFLPDEPWVRVAHKSNRPFVAHKNWVEIGWAVRSGFRGLGYATEIGRAGLAYAFDVLGMHAVVSCAVRHNKASLAVMERIGMTYVGEIRSKGVVECLAGGQDDAPYGVSVVLRADWK